MQKIEYNLNHTFPLLVKYISIIFIGIFVFSITLLADENEFYAIIKIDDRVNKLYIKGDIFYSKLDIDKCFRVEAIKKDILILKDINLNENILVGITETIPLKGTKMVFLKTVEIDSIKSIGRQ